MDIEDKLAEAPYRFDFFEAVRFLEAKSTDKPRLGRSKRPGDDPFRFGQECSLSFAPSTLSKWKQQEDGYSKLTQNFFGLFGPNGPLPLHLTEHARHRLRHVHDPAMIEFFDIFHHRLISLFYRAWADAQPTVQLDRKDQDRFGFYIDSLFGVAEPAMHQRDAMPDETKRCFAGRLAHSVPNAEGLEALLEDFFNTQVRIEEFIGEWLDIPDDNYCCLNDDCTTGQLGSSAIIGTRSWQCQHKFRIKLGPMTFEAYQRMLPTGGNMQSLVDIVRNYIGFELNWDINLILEKEEIPDTRLGTLGQLGWTAWLPGKAEQKNGACLFLSPGELTSAV